MQRLRGVQEGVQTRTSHRRASGVHEPEDRREFRRLDFRQDHRDRLAVARRSTVRQQHFLKPERMHDYSTLPAVIYGRGEYANA